MWDNEISFDNNKSKKSLVSIDSTEVETYRKIETHCLQHDDMKITISNTITLIYSQHTSDVSIHNNQGIDILLNVN